MTKFCTQCGTGLTDGVKFCGQCGTAIALVDTPAPAMQNGPILDTKPSSPAVGGWLLVICILLLLNGAGSLYTFLKTEIITGMSVLQLAFPAFGSLCGFMLMLKKSTWLRITRIYLGFQIILSMLVIAMFFYLMVISTSLFSDMDVGNKLLVSLLLLPLVISLFSFQYLSASERIKKTYPDAFK